MKLCYRGGGEELGAVPIYAMEIILSLASYIFPPSVIRGGKYTVTTAPWRCDETLYFLLSFIMFSFIIFSFIIFSFIIFFITNNLRNTGSTIYNMSTCRREGCEEKFFLRI